MLISLLRGCSCSKIKIWHNIFIFTCALFLFSCSANKNTQGNTQSSNNRNNKLTISQELESWNSRQKINLLNHQLIPIDYLEKNPEIKGLLIDHAMGSGKTYLAIGFAERNMSKRVIILAPGYLKGHWRNNLKSYGVQNILRYDIISHSDVDALMKADFTDSILIIDESHRIIERISSNDLSISNLYSQVYLKLSSAHRIISLTGTPIYTDMSDIAYQANLVSNKHLLPFNKFVFRKQYTTIAKISAFGRGHWAESQMLTPALTIFGSAYALTVIPSTIGLIACPIAFGLIPLGIKTSMPINNFTFREFDAKKLSDITEKYVSYYSFQEENLADYPAKTITYQDVTYNAYQLDFLIRFADSALTSDEILMLTIEDNLKTKSSHLELNSSKIQEQLKLRAGVAREIGNLSYLDLQNNQVYPPKFIAAFEKMSKANGPVVIYSHYYHNGILLFKKYLESRGENNYAVLSPDLSEDEYTRIINNYNNGKSKFLLLHPEIIEGVSLKATSQLHILEPCFNQSAQNQIIGRAIRYKSHAHLPKKDQKVDVYIWKQSISRFDVAHMTKLRENWHLNFSEVSYYTSNKLAIDPNHNIKSRSPDDIAYEKMNFLDKSGQSLIKLLGDYSLDLNYNNGKK